MTEIPRRIAELLAVPIDRVNVKVEPSVRRGISIQTDLLVSAGGFKFAVECKASGQAASVAMGIRSIRHFVEASRGKYIPLLVAPYLGEIGQTLCEEAKVCWLDLSGNARLIAPGRRVSIEGKPNLFKHSGRPSSVFAPKSARIARLLLIEPERAFSQRELAKASGLDEGFTSRIVRQLETQRLVTRAASGAVSVTNFDNMLNAWLEVYDFSKHHIVRGHIAARSSDAVLRQLSTQLEQNKIEYAATGLAAAWLLNQFAGFRLVAFYVKQVPSAEVCQKMGFYEEPRGENVWLVEPNDDGVFEGSSKRDGINCVHPVQAFLDLKNQPERSAEAAEELRLKFLKKDQHV